MSRLRRVADIDKRRRDQAGAELSNARRELTRHRDQLNQMMTPTGEGDQSSGQSMLAHRQAAGRKVERLVEATRAQRTVVDAAEEKFVETEKRARQMARAVEMETERMAADRRRAADRVMEDTVIAVTADRRIRPHSQPQPGSAGNPRQGGEQ
ncbi:MAG: hypothetical protein OES24_13790 [Acidimicrobiia bacterium]|nr:hypothetical protein [Acidimicrobiia bacterium]